MYFTTLGQANAPNSTEVPLQIWILGLGLLFCLEMKSSAIRRSISVPIFTML